MAVLPDSIEHFHRSKDGVYEAGQLFFVIRSRAFIVITVMKDIIKQEEETVCKGDDNEDDDNEDDDNEDDDNEDDDNDDDDNEDDDGDDDDERD